MLPSGITGFGDWEYPPTFQGGAGAFRRLSYALARQLSGEVLSLDLDLAGKNFYAAKIQTRQGEIYLLENAPFSWVAFARSLEFGEIAFTEPPCSLPEDCHVLSLQMLQKDWQEEAGALGKAELAQIAYWKPRTVGQIVFNFWD